MAKSYQCDMCEAHATVHLTHVMNNNIQKLHLCESCAEQKGLTKPDALKLPNLFEENITKPIVNNVGNILKCEKCGHTPADFKKIARLGCPSCYEHLSAFIEPALSNLHESITHKGKAPQHSIERFNARNRLKLVMNDLDKAIKEERYEDAALLKTELTKIQKTNDSDL